MVGYDEVARTARAAGMNVNIKATPSIALVSYEVTPLEIADAYTVFVNEGRLVKMSMVRGIRASDGVRVFQSKVEKKDALDPRVAYLTQSMMQEVLRSGTGAGVGRYGFNIGQFPAAGKTVPRATAGSSASPRASFAPCGWALTTTAISYWKAPAALCPSGETSWRARTNIASTRTSIPCPRLTASRLSRSTPRPANSRRRHVQGAHRSLHRRHAAGRTLPRSQ